MRVKSKVLNCFLGILQTDLPRLNIEAFPQELNKKILSLVLLKKTSHCWFDCNIEKRIATLKLNIFLGTNLGQSTYQLGILCLNSIAHLPEDLEKLTWSK